MKDYFSSLTPSVKDTDAQLSIAPCDSAMKVTQAAESVAIPVDLIAMPITDLLGQGMQCFKEYKIAKLREETERRRIAAQLHAITLSINARKESYIESITRDYAERDKLYTIAIENLKIAQENHDNEMVKEAYNFILSVFEGGINLSCNRMQLLDSF